MNLISLLASNNFLVVNKTLVKLLGLETSILLSELISEYEYWSNRDELIENEFFFSTVENIENNTTLSKHKQLKAMKKLQELNLVTVKLMGLPAKRYIKINVLEVENLVISCSKIKQLEVENLNVNNNKDNNNKDNNNNNIYIEIFNKWNEQNIIKHKELKEVHKKAIDKALKTYSKDEIIKAIEHYGKIIHSNYYFSYKWSLSDFLNRKNGISTFVDEGTNYINYLEWLSADKGYRVVNQIHIKSKSENNNDINNSNYYNDNYWDL